MPPCSYQRHSVCVVCGVEYVARNWSGPVSVYCGTECKNKARNIRTRELYALRKALSSCGNPYCRRLFSEPNRRLYCSPECQQVGTEFGKGKEAGESAAIRLGFLDACRIFYVNCIDCGSVTVRKWKAPGRLPCCRACAHRRYIAHNARKNHKRRAAGPKVMSVYEIAKRDGCSCYVCGKRVDMTLSGRAKWGPTIEHLVPVSRGGTNAPENLALSHRHCNTSRGNRGHAQLLLAV